MSREERRQYKRMMRNMERGPALPPAAQARAERTRARRETARRAAGPGGLARYWLVTLAAALVIGLLAFSVQWPSMPFALYVGIAAAVATVAVSLGLRWLQRRAATTTRR